MTINQRNFLNNYLIGITIYIFYFTPKIDLIEIYGFYQGIRVEDILVLMITVSIIINRINIFDRNYIGFSFILLGIYLAFVCLVQLYFGKYINIIMFLRYIEYIFIIIFLNNINLSKKNFYNIFSSFLYVNLAISILQLLGLIGTFTSSGYINEIIENRVTGITGGSWEISVLASLAFFGCIVSRKKFDVLLILNFLIALFLVFMSGTRGTFVAFIFSSLIFFASNDKIIFYIKKHLKSGLFYIFISIILLCTLIYFLNKFFFTVETDNMRDYYTKQRFATNYFYVLELFYNFFITLKVPTSGEIRNEVGDGWRSYYSLYLRFSFWKPLLEEHYSSLMNIIIGSGLNKIYLESLWIRLFITFGILGTIMILILCLKIPLYLFVFFLLSGLTLDLFISFKIFFATILLFLVIYKKE